MFDQLGYFSNGNSSTWKLIKYRVNEELFSSTFITESKSAKLRVVSESLNTNGCRRFNKYDDFLAYYIIESALFNVLED